MADLLRGPPKKKTHVDWGFFLAAFGYNWQRHWVFFFSGHPVYLDLERRIKFARFTVQKRYKKVTVCVYRMRRAYCNVSPKEYDTSYPVGNRVAGRCNAKQGRKSDF